MNHDYTDGYLKAIEHVMSALEARIEVRKNCSCPSQVDLARYRTLLDIYSVVAEIPAELLKGGANGK